MSVLELEPVDVITIRNARPFDVGGIVLADSVWPPPPWTILGAIRGALCELMGLAAVDYADESASGTTGSIEQMRKILGEPRGAASFALGPTLTIDPHNEILWPTPADICVYEEEKGDIYRLRRLKLEEVTEGTACSVPEGRLGVLVPPRDAPRGGKEGPPAHFSTTLLQQWLSGEARLKGPTKAELGQRGATAPWSSDLRTGIQMDNTSNTVRQGMFYLRETTSLRHGARLLVPLIEPGPNLPWQHLHGQLARLGADGHAARVRFFPDRHDFPPAPGTGLTEACLLCLSPIRPEDLDSRATEPLGFRVRNVAAGKPLRIGGWQLAHNGHRQHGPRPLRVYYPPGTVLYVEGTQLERLHGRSIANDPAERSAGFAVCLVGRLPCVP